MPAPSGLVSWWPGDGNAADIASTNTGVLQGGTTASAPGIIGPAFSFDGTNGFVQVPDSPSLRPTNLTIECWVRFASQDSAGSGSSSAGDQYMLFKQNTRSSDFEGLDLSKTRVGGSNVLRFQVASASGQAVVINSSTLVSTGVWYHVAAVRGTNFVQLYENGALERQAAVNFPQDYGSFPLYFGTSGQTYWDHKLNGSLDEVSLYNRALSAGEIGAIYAAGSVGKCKAPNLTTQPQSQAVLVGSNATFAISATGFGVIRYQWQKHGTNLVDGGRITGAATPALTISGALGSDAGAYRVVVTNAAGTAASAEAVLSVVPILGWGYNYYGQATAPAGATNFVALDAGWQHALALRADGTLVTWGYSGSGLAPIPAEAVNVVAMAVGDYHNLVLRADGTVLAWGKNEAGESSVPANAANVVALAGGYSHSLALRFDGTVIGWGDNTFGQVTIPAAATNVVAIAAGLDNSLALKADGSVVAWGINQEGETNVPPGATNVVAISAGATHCLALKSDGTIAAWGSSVFGETAIPTNVINVTAISSGGWDNLAVLQDGTVTGWGYDYHGQATPPVGATNPAAIFAGGEFSLAWLRDPSTGVPPRFWQ